MLLLFAGVLALALGVWRLFQNRERVDALILWGAVADLGLILLGCGVGGPAGRADPLMCRSVDRLIWFARHC